MKAPKYLLLGGSNCVIKDGFGAELQKILPGDWENVSLGNTSSLRGAAYVLEHRAALQDVDRIFIEYTLNDLIFEVSNSLHPQAHLAWLTAMATPEEIRFN